MTARRYERIELGQSWLGSESNSVMSNGRVFTESSQEPHGATSNGRAELRPIDV